MNLDKFGPVMKGGISILVIVAFLGCIAALFFTALREKDFPPGVKETLLVLIGVLAGSFKDTVGYWLGSSHGSERKTELMAGK
jgi:membrane protein DedA with SNARE-associated domain